MGFINNVKKIFAKKEEKPYSKEIEVLLSLHEKLKNLLLQDKYIARSDFRSIVDDYGSVKDFFAPLEKGGFLETYFKNNGLDVEKGYKVIKQLDQIETSVKSHNIDYVKKEKEREKHYLDNVLKEVDPIINLDENQRDAVVVDEDYCLIIAGAGAGKTTTVAAKVKYLADRKGIKPEQILVISFTNKAVNELKERINDSLNIPCPITTFHSTGNAIIRKTREEPLNIVDSARLYFVLMDYFRDEILKNQDMVDNIIMFFASYLNSAETEQDLKTFFRAVATGRYSTLKSDLGEYIEKLTNKKTNRQITITNELLRSMEEVKIANFLYLNNIDYEYEAIYPYSLKDARKPYTPDFTIKQEDKVVYIEHFGITESGKSNKYSPEDLEIYKRVIREKVKLHKEHKTDLIYTFSQYNDKRDVLVHLEEKLIERGFLLKPRSRNEVLKKLVEAEQSNYIRRLLALIERFIHNFKTRGFGYEKFDFWIDTAKNERNKLFLRICRVCYLEYQKHLEKNNSVDFEDMINNSAKILKEAKEIKEELDFKYVIVDEYQDISMQRYDLTKALSEVTGAKIVAVGDDWQSIYAFSGSEISLFVRFAETLGYAEELKIVNTYRNAQEVIDIAGTFIQKNQEQIQKRLISPKTIEDPVIIYTYDGTKKYGEQSRRSGAGYNLAAATERAIEDIIEFSKKEGKKNPGSILLLGRYGFDGDSLERSGLFQYIVRGQKVRSVKYPKLDITFMTVHSSKGLGYDNVIVVNGRNETYGFPSKIEDDPVLKYVVTFDYSYEQAEERRLFYVAMTRTKNRVFFIAPKQNPSEFLLEIKKDFKTIQLIGEWNEKEENLTLTNECPICAYPLQLRFRKSFGLSMYICTNEPEICGFLSNNLIGEKMTIQKCNQCATGYLIVKSDKLGEYEPFLGCTNYKADGSGCKNTINKETYYSLNNLEYNKFQKKVVPEKEEPPKKETPKKVVPPKEEVSKRDPISTPEKSEITPKVSPSKDNKVVKVLPIIYFNNKNLVLIISTILETIKEINEIKFFGKTVIINVLRGSLSKIMKENKLDQLKGYGSLKDVPREHLDLIMDWLISEQFIYQRGGKYPVIHMAYNGNNYNETLTLTHLRKLAQLLIKYYPNSEFYSLDAKSKLKKDFSVYAKTTWNKDDEELMLKMLKDGNSIEKIAKTLKRGKSAVIARIRLLEKERKN